MRIIDQDPRIVFLGDRHQRREVDNLARSAEYSIRNDQFSRVVRQLRENGLEMLHVVVLVAHHIRSHPKRDHVSGDDAGMIVLIGYYVLSSLYKRRNNPLRSLKTGAKQKAFFAPDELGQSSLEFDMEVKRTRQIARTGATGPVFHDSFYGGFFDFRMSR